MMTLKNNLHIFYSNKLKIKETTESPSAASNLDLNLCIDDTGRFKSKLYDKRDVVDSPIVNLHLVAIHT